MNGNVKNLRIEGTVGQEPLQTGNDQQKVADGKSEVLKMNRKLGRRGKGIGGNRRRITSRQYRNDMLWAQKVAREVEGSRWAKKWTGEMSK